MSDPVTMGAAVGAGSGLLFNKKDPMKGALMGAGLGAAGGYFAPMLGIGAGAKPGLDAIGHLGAAEAAGAPIAMEEAQMLAGPLNPANETPLGMTPLGGMMKNPLVPMGASMMMGGQQPLQMPPMMMPQMPQRQPFMPGSFANSSPFVMPTRPYAPSRGWKG